MSKNFTIRTIRSFIRDYGTAVSWVVVDGSTRDLDTGALTNIETIHKIKKALPMPETVTRKFSYDLSYIAANKNFVYGGFFDREDLSMIFLTRDLPGEYSLNDEVIHNETRFIVHEIWTNPEGAVAANLRNVV